MFPTEDRKDIKTKDVWIISEGRFVSLDLSNICEQSVSKPVTEYSISELARYLLNPKQVTVQENVIGCRIKYHKSRSGFIGRTIKNIFMDKKSSSDDTQCAEENVSMLKTGDPSFQDEDLNKHFLKINDMLRPYDPVLKKFSVLNI